jgi:hypothetical protein
MDASRMGDAHGRGIAIAKMISFDKIVYHGSGNCVTLSVVTPTRDASMNVTSSPLGPLDKQADAA